MQSEINPATPNPGSDAAQQMGCTCPVLDNGHGAGYMGKAGVFWFSEGCPVHCRNEQKLEGL